MNQPNTVPIVSTITVKLMIWTNIMGGGYRNSLKVK